MDVSAIFSSVSSGVSDSPLPEKTEGVSEGLGAAALIGLRVAMAAAVADPANEIAAKNFCDSRRRVALAAAKLPRKFPSGAGVSDVFLLIRDLSFSGLPDRRVDAEDLKLATATAAKGWPGLLGAMLLVPAWQWPDAPLLLNVPDWMRADFVSWLFAAPQGFCAVGDAETYANHILRRSEELVRWVNRCPGTAAEAEVLGAYVAQNNSIPLYFSSGNLRKHAELRGRLLARASAQTGATVDLLPQAREGRPLRVGFVNRHFSSQTETYTTIPSFEYLDAEKFEVQLFCHRMGESVAENFCRKHAATFTLLPDGLSGQLDVLRAAELDVVVFGTNVTAVCNEVSLLALHRVAPLQVVNNSSCITSGFSEVDLYVSGSLTETSTAEADFSERLGLLPGPAHAFNYECDYQEARVSSTRAEFKIPEDAFVFVSGANYFKIIPEMQQAWARILAAVPNSYLLLHPFNPNWASSYPSQRFRADLSAVLVEHGVSPARLAISTLRLPSRTDVKGLLALGNVYLDTFPFGGVNSLVDPLELGLPVVAWEGNVFRSRMGAALLRSLDLPHLIAQDAKEYHTIAVGLAHDVARRADLCGRIRAKMDQSPIFLDRLAASDAMGDLLETAYDELSRVGRKKFREDRETLSASKLTDSGASAVKLLRASPAHAVARREYGRELVAAGRPARAILYFLAALNGGEKNPGLWLDLATAFHANGQFAQAIEAVEASLRLDSKQIAGWKLLAELGQHFQATQLATEALQMVAELEKVSAA